MDEGIAETIKILNEKGYRTTCSCEGHIYYCDGYVNPKKRREYGQYSPVWIVFEYGYLPSYLPEVYPRVDKNNGHASVYLSSKKDLWQELFVYFELNKKERGKFSEGDVHKEHERVLNEVLKWAQSLPKRT